MSQFGADLAALAGNGADATRAWDIGDAALAGDVAALQSAIEAGADVNSANDRGAHPLMLAAHDANVECVSLLLQSGADAHRATRKGRTALHVATTRRALWVKGHGSFIAKPPPADDAAIARIIAQFDEVIDLLESHAIDKAVAECAAAQLRGGRLPPPPQLMAPIFPPIAAFSGGAGSGNPPYKPVQEREQVAGAPGQVQVYQYCSISKMDQYQSKSFEELRYEDYAKGNTGATPGAAALGGVGAAATPSPFGSAAASPFSAAPAPAATPFVAGRSPFGVGAPPSAAFPVAPPFGASGPSNKVLPRSLMCRGAEWGFHHDNFSGDWQLSMAATQRTLLNGRPHYVHKTKSAGQAHLFHVIDPTYHVPRWVIGPTAGGNDGWAYCESDASTPHEILGTWIAFDGFEWSSCKSLRFEPKEGEGNDGSVAAAPAPPSPFGAPRAGGVLFGSPASATTSPFAPAPAASSPFGPPAPASSATAVLNVVGAGAHGFVNGEYRVDVAAGLKNGVPSYIKVGDPWEGPFGSQSRTIMRREGKWWMASSLSNQPPTMLYSVASTDDKPPPTGWGRDGCVPFPPSAEMPSIVPMAAVLRVEGAGAHGFVNGEYRVDVAAGLKNGVPSYIKVGDPWEGPFGSQSRTIMRREGKWWMASSLSNQPPTMLYSVASTDDKPPPTGWGRDGCVPFPPSAEMPSIVPMAAGAMASVPFASGGPLPFGVVPPPAASPFGGGAASGSPFGAPRACGALFGSPASATASPFAPAPAASSVFGSPSPASSATAVLRVVGAGAYDHVNGEYRVDVAAGLKDGVPCYVKVGDPSVASGNVQVTSSIIRREGKWWMASSVSNQPPSMVYSVASADDKPPPTGWGRDGCVPLPTGFFAPSADKMALMPSIVPLVPVAGAVVSAPIATGGPLPFGCVPLSFGGAAPAAAPFGAALGGGGGMFGGGGASTSPFGAPRAGGGIFGSPASATASPFAPAPPAPAAAASSGFSFGGANPAPAPAPTTSPFGAPRAGGGIFGSPASATASPFAPAPFIASSPFGAPPAAGTSIFAANPFATAAPAMSASLFGAPPPAVTPVDTRAAWARTASPEAQRAVADRDARALVALLQASPSGSRQSVASGIAILADAPADQCMDPMREALAAAGVFPPLVAMLGDGTAEERAAAAEALWKLSRNDANKAAIAAAGAIVPLAALVRDGDAKGKANAAAVLGYLSIGNAANKAAIAAAGAIVPLAALVRDGDAQGKAYAAHALGNLSIGNAATTAAIAAAGAIVPLAALVRDGDAQGKAYAAHALGNLSNGNAANTAAIAAAGAIVPLAALVRDGDAQAAIAAAGAIVPLAALVRDGDAEGKRYAALALGNLSNGNAANEAAMVAAGAVESLKALMRDGDAKGKEAAARAVGSLRACHFFGGAPAPSGLSGGGASAPSCGLLGSAPAPIGGVASSPAPFGGVAPPAASLFGGAPFGGVAPPAASPFGGGAAASSPLGGAPSLFAPKPAFGAAGTPGAAPYGAPYGGGAYGAAHARDSQIESQLDKWVAAKRAKDFATADRLREELRKMGVEPDCARRNVPSSMSGGGGAPRGWDYPPSSPFAPAPPAPAAAASSGFSFGGANPAPALAPAPTTSPFGAPRAGGGLFDSPASATASPFAPAPATSSVFGPAPAPPPPALIGSPEAATASSFGAIAPSASPPSVGEFALVSSLADEL